ncbi:MAG: NAD(P)H-hydrate epimerase [Tepidisphaeraceae bacterium]
MLRLTRAQVREVDRLASERYHIPSICLMENAARAAADVACQMLDNDCVGEILIVCGPGNNGGDGLAMARFLHNRGADVTIALAADPAKYKGDAKTNYGIVLAIGLPVLSLASPEDIRELDSGPCLLVVDAVFGTGLSRPPDESFARVVAFINRPSCPVLSIDVPSGLDCDTGQPLGPACVRATRTVTFVAEKVGFAVRPAPDYLGHVHVADIGCPPEVVDEVAS